MQGGVLCLVGGSGEGGGEEQPGRAEGGSKPASCAARKEEEKEEESWTGPDRRSKTSWQLSVQVYVNIDFGGFIKNNLNIHAFLVYRRDL